MNRLAIYNKATGELQFFIENGNATQVQLLANAVNQMSKNFLAKAEVDDQNRPTEEIEPKPGSEQFIPSEDISLRIKPAIAILKDLLARAETRRKEEATHKAAQEALLLEAQRAQALPDLSGQIYVTMDGDNIGNKVAQAQFSNDEAKVKEVSRKIDAGKACFETWANQYNGEIIESGGDEGQVKLPAAALDHIEEFRTKYKDLVGATVSVGVGKTMSESIQARELAKLRGKNQTVVYDDSTERELKVRMDQKGEETPESKIKDSGVLGKAEALERLGLSTEFEANKRKEEEYQAWLKERVNGKV